MAMAIAIVIVMVIARVIGLGARIFTPRHRSQPWGKPLPGVRGRQRDKQYAGHTNHEFKGVPVRSDFQALGFCSAILRAAREIQC